MLSSAGVAGRLFKECFRIITLMLDGSTSEIGISCVIDEIYSELAVKAIHKAFMEI